MPTCLNFHCFGIQINSHILLEHTLCKIALTMPFGNEEKMPMDKRKEEHQCLRCYEIKELTTDIT